MTEPTVNDIIIPPSLARQSDPNSLHRMLNTLFLVMRRNSVAQREHRKALIELGDVASVSDEIAALSLTASASYTQAEIQSIADKLDAVIARQNEIAEALNTIISSSDTNLVAAQGAETIVS